jgi:hypothetical protein
MTDLIPTQPRRRRYLPSGLFLLALLFFPLPWLRVECRDAKGNVTERSWSGLQFAAGGVTERTNGRVERSALTAFGADQVDFAGFGFVLELSDRAVLHNEVYDWVVQAGGQTGGPAPTDARRVELLVAWHGFALLLGAVLGIVLPPGPRRGRALAACGVSAFLALLFQVLYYALLLELGLGFTVWLYAACLATGAAAAASVREWRRTRAVAAVAPVGYDERRQVAAALVTHAKG